jgi:hypothetical protein
MACFREPTPPPTDFPPSPSPEFFYRSSDSPVRRPPEDPYSPAYEWPPANTPSFSPISPEEAANLINNVPLEDLIEMASHHDSLFPNLNEE